MSPIKKQFLSGDLADEDRRVDDADPPERERNGFKLAFIFHYCTH